MDDFKKIEVNGGRYCTASMVCTNKAVYIGKASESIGSFESVAYCQKCKDDEESIPLEFKNGDK